MSHETTIARRPIEIVNHLGLHLRAADQFVRLARQFQSEIRVHHHGKDSNGKSVLGLMTLAAGRGTHLELEARGADAVESLAGLVTAGFYEETEGDSAGAEPGTEPAP
jgi:phosphocarrier protein